MRSQDLRLYVLMRNDLQSMPPGRCMAQAAHAADACRKEYGNHPDYKEWAKQTKQGFGTVIVLAASEPVIAYLFTESSLRKWKVKGWVTDPEYCIMVTPEVAGLLHQMQSRRYGRPRGSSPSGALLGRSAASLKQSPPSRKRQWSLNLARLNRPQTSRPPSSKK